MQAKPANRRKADREDSTVFPKPAMSQAISTQMHAVGADAAISA
jgi:hypothetical protein